MKTCSVCKITKDYSLFATQKTGRDGYRANCKQCDCDRAKRRVRTEEQKQKGRDATKAYYYKNQSIEQEKARNRYYEKTEGVVKRKQKRNFKSKEEEKAHKAKEHRDYMRKHPEKAQKSNKQMREKFGETINARCSLVRTLGISYKETKNFPELIELKKIQLAGLKEASLQLNPNNKIYKPKKYES